VRLVTLVIVGIFTYCVLEFVKFGVVSEGSVYIIANITTTNVETYILIP
jgi:predicted type IV restriction endonuclease